MVKHPELRQPASGEPAQRERAAYRKPQLIRYGSLREITRAIGTMGAMDGAPMNAMTRA